MKGDFEISISRTPDGKPIVSRNPNVSLSGECIINQPADASERVFIHLEVIHKGVRYPVWICETQSDVGELDLARIMSEEKKEEIVEEFRKRHQAS